MILAKEARRTKLKKTEHPPRIFVAHLKTNVSDAQRSKIRGNETRSFREGNDKRGGETGEAEDMLEGINHWPIPIEGDGARSTDFDALLKNVSDKAEKIRGQELNDLKLFKAKWIFILEEGDGGARTKVDRKTKHPTETIR